MARDPWDHKVHATIVVLELLMMVFGLLFGGGHGHKRRH